MRSKYELPFLDKANSSSDPSHILILQFTIPRASLSPFAPHLCQILGKPTDTPLQRSFHYVLHWFPYFVLPYSTTRHHKYWICQVIWQAKSIKFTIKLYADNNTLWVKHTIHLKAESLRTSSLSKFNFQHGQQ